VSPSKINGDLTLKIHHQHGPTSREAYHTTHTRAHHAHRPILLRIGAATAVRDAETLVNCVKTTFNSDWRRFCYQQIEMKNAKFSGEMQRNTVTHQVFIKKIRTLYFVHLLEISFRPFTDPKCSLTRVNNFANGHYSLQFSSFASCFSQFVILFSRLYCRLLRRKALALAENRE
jgi:hypothetical protein